MLLERNRHGVNAARGINVYGKMHRERVIVIIDLNVAVLLVEEGDFLALEGPDLGRKREAGKRVNVIVVRMDGT
jgi:hypothetical protein